MLSCCMHTDLAAGLRQLWQGTGCPAEWVWHTEEGGGGIFLSRLSRGRWRTRPGFAGLGFLSSQSVVFIVWRVAGVS